ncbi:hypothetical protein YQE_02620, partial [Dendroctonus ponderosae]
MASTTRGSRDNLSTSTRALEVVLNPMEPFPPAHAMEEKVCPDGILFNAEAASRAFPCQDPIDSRLKPQTNVPISSATSEWATSRTAASSRTAWMDEDSTSTVQKAWPGTGIFTDEIDLTKYPIATLKPTWASPAPHRLVSSAWGLKNTASSDLQATVRGTISALRADPGCTTAAKEERLMT